MLELVELFVVEAAVTGVFEEELTPVDEGNVES
jgi:hypothetical protein